MEPAKPKALIPSYSSKNKEAQFWISKRKKKILKLPKNEFILNCFKLFLVLSSFPRSKLRERGLYNKDIQWKYSLSTKGNIPSTTEYLTWTTIMKKRPKLLFCFSALILLTRTKTYFTNALNIDKKFQIPKRSLCFYCA